MYSQADNFYSPEDRKTAGPLKTPWYRKWWGILAILFFGFLMVFVTAFGIYLGQLVYLIKTGQISGQQVFGTSNGASGPGSDLISEQSYRRGPAKAKVVIIEFGDYTCPACQQVQPVIKQLLADYGDKILFVYRDFPALADRPLAVIAAVAANCAGAQGKFWEMHERLFATKTDLTEEILKTYALQLGLDGLEFGNCLVDESNLKRIENDLQQGYGAGVRATPTFFINGRMVAGALPYSLFEKAVTAALSQ